MGLRRELQKPASKEANADFIRIVVCLDSEAADISSRQWNGLSWGLELI